MNMPNPKTKGDHNPNYRRLPRILFVSECTGGRTVMAEFFARDLGEGLIDVMSAGAELTPLDPRTIEVMREAGYDVRDYNARVVSRDLAEWADVIVVLCATPGKVHPYVPEGAVRKDWPIRNPARQAKDERDKAPFVKARDDIRRRIQQLVNAIKLSRIGQG